MAQTIKETGHTLTSPWVLGALEGHGASVINVFQRDKNGVESSDILVADVSQPSIGVGMEIMAAYCAGRRIILVQRRGIVTSGMLQHMEGKQTVEFDDERSLATGLRDALQKA